MNREIKFRGKRIDNGEWVYGSLVIDSMTGDTMSIIEWADMSESNKGDGAYVWIDVIPETVGQYTGLKDKNGKEIYEGDILKRRGAVSFVVWVLDRWRYNSWMPGSMDLYDSVNKTRGGDYEIAEVIGNIYENPELLK